MSEMLKCESGSPPGRRRARMVTDLTCSPVSEERRSGQALPVWVLFYSSWEAVSSTSGVTLLTLEESGSLNHFPLVTFIVWSR